MESKHKNVLIVALLAVVLVMAVGYAAFTQQLTINSTATIQESGEGGKKNWDVKFDTTKTNAYQVTKGTGGSIEPTANITFPSATTATITANLNTPGDEVVYTFTVQNKGTINATLSQPVLAITDGTDTDKNPGTMTYNNVIFEVSQLGSTTLNVDGTTTFTVTATFDPDATEVTSENNVAKITVTFTASQATA